MGTQNGPWTYRASETLHHVVETKETVSSLFLNSTISCTGKYNLLSRRSICANLHRTPHPRNPVLDGRGGVRPLRELGRSDGLRIAVDLIYFENNGVLPLPVHPPNTRGKPTQHQILHTQGKTLSHRDHHIYDSPCTPLRTTSRHFRFRYILDI